MWKSVKLHFSVNTNNQDFLKVNSFFMGFKIQFCFQILFLKAEKYRFKQEKVKMDFLGEKNAILTNYYVFGNLSNFPVEAFGTKTACEIPY